MKKIGILLMGFILPLSLLAYEDIEIDKEDIVIIKEAGIAAKAVSDNEHQVVILNNQQVDQKAVHDQNAQVSHQPIVRVIGTPITATYATELKKSRQNAELQTEQKIVEKLESSRLMDEQERLTKLFGNKPAQKAVVTSSQAIVVEGDKAVDGSEVYTEVVSPVQDKGTDRVYMGIHGGQASNLTHSLENVESFGSVGLSFGAYDDSGLILESSFFYAKHEIKNQSGNYYYNNAEPFREVDQLVGSLSLKFTPSSGRFRPYAGVAVSYNYWLDEYKNADGTCYNSPYCDNSIQSNYDSVDLGANVGMDFILNHKISIGFNMLINVLNLTHNRPSPKVHPYRLVYDNYYNVNNAKEVNLEETNWLIASINAKLYF